MLRRRCNPIRHEHEYTRLTGKARPMDGLGAFLNSQTYSLWLGRDHLLSVEHEFGGERYRRFHFRDIGAIIVRRTPTGRTFSYVCAGLSGLLAAVSVLSASSLTNVVAALACGVAAVLFLVLLVVNVSRGPTCVCHVQTAVRRESVPSLCRLRTARAVLPRVVEAIRTRQQDLAAVIEDNPLSGAHSAGGARGESEQGGEETKSLDPTYDGGLHHSAYVLFVAVGVFGGAGLARSDVGLLVIGLLLGGLGAVCLAVAAIKQTQSRVAGMLSGVTWVAMGIALVVFLCYQGVKMAVVLRDTGPSGRVWQPLLAVFEDATEGLTPAFALLAFASVAAFIVGGVGLIAVRDHRRRIRSEGVAPPPIPARAGPEPAED